MDNNFESRIIEGRNSVLEAFRSGKTIDKLFVLDGCEGKLHYEQKPKASYSLYSDYYWYEIGDMICIGDMKTLYYCFPKESGDLAAKARIATEEIFKMVQP